MSALAFMPWVTIKNEVVLGQYRLVPVNLPEPGISEDTTPRMLPEPAVRILAGYASYPGSGITSATLIQRVGREITEDYTPEERANVFMLRDALAFAGLARREFFQFARYLNTDSFELIVQEYSKDASHIMLKSRRRDGHAKDGWENQPKSFVKPQHVFELPNHQIDVDFVGRVFAAMIEEKYFCRSIQWFNQANTDSPSIRQEFELVALLSAFQRLLDVTNSQTGPLEQAFTSRLAVHPSALGVSSDREKVQRKLKEGLPLRQIWMHDLHHVRGRGAHGRELGPSASAWTVQEHLLLGAFIFPALVEVVLADGQPLPGDLRGRLEAIDYLLAAGPLLEKEPSSNLASRPERFGWVAALERVDLVLADIQHDVEEAARKSESKTSGDGGK